MSQHELGEAIGVSQPTVCALEADRVPLGEVAAIALENLTGGAVKAIECVHPSKRDRLEAILSTQHVGGAA